MNTKELFVFSLLLLLTLSTVNAITTTNNADPQWNTRTTVSFYCTNSGAGCKDLNYSLNNGSWNIGQFSSFAGNTLFDKNCSVSGGYALTFSNYWNAQNFVATKNNVKIVTVKPAKVGTPEDLIVTINTTSAGVPTTTILGTATIPKASMSGYPTANDVNVTFTTAIPTTVGETYAIVMSSPATTGGPGNNVSMTTVFSDSCTDTAFYYSSNSGSSWNSQAKDIYYKLYYVTDANGSITVPDGNTYIQYKSTDFNGTIETIKTAYHAVDLTPPVTTFSSFQVPNTTDQNITLTCTDNNTGCKTIHYTIDSTAQMDINKSTFYTTTIPQGDPDSSGYVLVKSIDLNLFEPSNNYYQNFTLLKMCLNRGTSDTIIGKLRYIYEDNSIEDSSESTWGSAGENCYTKSSPSGIPTKRIKQIQTWAWVYIPAGTAYIKADINYYNIFNDGNYRFIFSGSGVHSIQYFSTDNQNNNETTKTNNFTTYGNGRFNFRDENTGALITGITVNDGTTTTVTAGSTYDINFQNLSGTQLYTFSKTGYETRYYQLDANNFTDFNINFALMPTTLSSEVTFRFYKPDETTAYANIYVQVKDTNTNYILGRLKTDATGLVTFNLDQNATGLQFDMNNGENTYNAVLLTINRPKDEQTLLDINANWNYQISGLASYVDTNVSSSAKLFAIYSNTVQSYSVTIGSNSLSPVYASRKFDIQVFGNTSTYTLQPYLIDVGVAVTTTLNTKNAYTNQTIGGISIKIYRNLPGIGKTIIEETVTNGLGQSVVYLLFNQTYQFEINVGTTTIRTETYTISSTSSEMFFKIDPGYDLNSTPQTTSIFAFMSPGRNYLTTTDTNIIANVVYGTNQNSVTAQSINVRCYNDTNLMFSDNFSLPTMNFIQAYDFNATTKTLNSIAFDGNYPILCTIAVGLSDGNIVTASQQYVVSNNEPQNNLGFNLRPAFGCVATNDANIPCPGMILGALFITMLGVAGIMIESGFTYPEFGGLLFMIGLGFFTFFTWIPPILFIIVLAIGIFIYAALGVKRI